MNTPPFHRYHSSPNSSYGIRTPNTESSFDCQSNYTSSDRHSDRPLFGALSTQPSIETRRLSLTEAELLGTGSSFARGISPSPLGTSAMEKDWLYFVYTKCGAKWDEDIIIDELPWSEAAIRKKAASKSERGSVHRQMHLMGPNRRGQIERHAALLGSMEVDGSIWEPVWMDNIRWKVIGLTSEVIVFEVIFARKQPRGFTSSPIRPPTLPLAAEIEIITAEPSEERRRKEQRKSKDIRMDNSSARTPKDDAFGRTEWFDIHSGAASTGLGLGGLSSRGQPTASPVQKTVNTPKPKVVQGLDFDQEVFGVYASGALGSGDSPRSFRDSNEEAREILQNLPPLPKKDDGIVVVEDNQESKRHSRHSSKDKTQRRGTNSSADSRPSFVDLRQRLDSSLRNTRVSSPLRSRSELPRSGASSATSGDGGVVFDEIDELNSQSSRGTGSSSSRKSHRPVPSSSRYELTSENGLLAPSRSRRRSARTVDRTQTQTPYGIEQPLTRSNTSPRSTPPIRQASLSGEVPPIVVYPDYFDKEDRQKNVLREDRDEQRAHEYMERTVREKKNEKRGDEVREDYSLQSEMGKLRLDRESGGVRRSVYNHEPREAYDAARRGL